MATMRKSIPLNAEEDSLLKKLYQIYRVPSDQFKRRPKAVARYVRDWHSLSGRDDPWEDIYHYIVTKRKQKKWPTLDGDFHQLADPDWDMLTAGEWAALEQVYQETVISRGVGSDLLLFDSALSAELARGFAKLTGRSFSGAVSAALIVSKRKRGEWVHLRSKKDDGDLGFGDINEVA